LTEALTATLAELQQQQQQQQQEIWLSSTVASNKVPIIPRGMRRERQTTTQGNHTGTNTLGSVPLELQRHYNLVLIQSKPRAASIPMERSVRLLIWHA
jgi:hypothetical protein